MTAEAEKQTLAILGLGLFAFIFDTIGGIFFAFRQNIPQKFIKRFSKLQPIGCVLPPVKNLHIDVVMKISIPGWIVLFDEIALKAGT